MELGGLYKTILDKNVPFSACLEVTTRCNNRCVHCYNAGVHDLPLDVAKRCLREMAELGTLFLTVTGGEPMLREDIWEILEDSVRLGFATLLYTNATLIGKAEAGRLKEAGVYHVDTTLLGSSADTHDRLTRSQGSFEKTIAAIRHIRDAGMSILVKTPLLKENASEAVDIQRFVEGMGVQFMSSPLIFSKDDGDSGPLAHRLDDPQMKEFFKRGSVRSFLDYNGGYPCYMGISTLAVRADGEVHPCISVPMSGGNVKEVSLKKIWADSEKFSYIRGNRDKMILGCTDCGIKEWCFRCEGMAFFENGIFTPAAELCRMARIRKEASVERQQ